MTRSESEHVAVYLLFGERDDETKPVVYIGQTEDLRSRLKSHHAKKEFWRTAIFIISRTHSFTQAHIKYLEWYCIQKAKEAGRFAFDNLNDGAKPFVTEPMEADLLDNFDTVNTLISALGYPVFEPFIIHRTSGEGNRARYHCSGPDAKGSGEMTDEGFVVFKGAKVRAQLTASADYRIADQQEKMRDNKILVGEGSSLTLDEDFLFKTPSQASALVLGRSSNGWRDWKNSDGKTLDEIWRRNKDS